MHFPFRIKPISYIILCLLTSFVTLYAEGLDFPRSSLEVTATAEDQKLTLHFPFTNRTSKALTIARYESECSCMEIGSEDRKMRFEPGESGRIYGTFMIGNSTGIVEKNIRVWLEGDPADHPSHVLKLKVTIPELLSIEPKTLQWNVGSETNTKAAHITLQSSRPIQITAVSCSDPIFSHTLKTLEEGKAYELSVSCSSTARKAMGILKIETTSPLEGQRIIQLFTVVR